jgi:hypothetical protein
MDLPRGRDSRIHRWHYDLISLIVLNVITVTIYLLLIALTDDLVAR